jgi:hypothetical protein
MKQYVKIINIQSYLEQKNKTAVQIILENYNHQNSIVLAWKLKTDEWNQIESLEKNSYINSWQTFDRDTNNTHWRKVSSFQ